MYIIIQCTLFHKIIVTVKRGNDYEGTLKTVEYYANTSFCCYLIHLRNVSVPLSTSFVIPVSIEKKRALCFPVAI